MREHETEWYRASGLASLEIPGAQGFLFRKEDALWGKTPREAALRQRPGCAESRRVIQKRPGGEIGRGASIMRVPYWDTKTPRRGDRGFAVHAS